MTRRSYTSLFSVLRALRGKVQSYKLSSLFFINASVLFTIIVIYYIPYVILFCWYHRNIVFEAIILLVSPQYRVCGHFFVCMTTISCCGHYFVGITTISCLWAFFFEWPQYGVCGHYFVGMTTISCLWPLFCLYDHKIVFMVIILFEWPQYRVCGHFLFVWPHYRVCGHNFVCMTTILCLWPLFCLYDHNIVFVTIILFLWPQYRVCDYYFDHLIICNWSIRVCLWPRLCM